MVSNLQFSSVDGLCTRRRCWKVNFLILSPSCGRADTFRGNFCGTPGISVNVVQFHKGSIMTRARKRARTSSNLSWCLTKSIDIENFANMNMSTHDGKFANMDMSMHDENFANILQWAACNVPFRFLSSCPLFNRTMWKETERCFL